MQKAGSEERRQRKRGRAGVWEGGTGTNHGGTKGGNERESRDGESKIEHRESGEAKAGEGERGGKRTERECDGGKQHYKAHSAIWGKVDSKRGKKGGQ